jgi:peptidoglycan/LPS O-acetylase OafA/YrhL
MLWPLCRTKRSFHALKEDFITIPFVSSLLNGAIWKRRDLENSEEPGAHAILFAGRRMLQFQRITTQKRFIPQIDGLRFVAIGSVVLFHIYAALERGAVPPPIAFNTDLAKRGVELFFAISGFVLGVPFASRYLLGASEVDLKQYFLRRLTRLEPPYFISIFVCAAMQIVWSHRPASDIGPHVLASFGYLHNMIYGAFPGAVNGVAWSLEIEVQFYVLVPLLTTLFAISNSLVRRVVILALMLWAGLLSNPLYPMLHLHASIAYYLSFFLAGFLVCDLYLTRAAWKQSFLWDALAMCGWPLVWLLGRNSGHVILPFVIVVLYLAAFRGRICSAVFSNQVITNIGGMCYSIYLFHFLVIYAVKHFTAPLHIGQNFWVYYALQATLILPAVLLICGTFFLLIERPCMDREWPRKLWRFGHALTLPVARKREAPLTD